MAEKQTAHVMGRLVQHQAHINLLTAEEATWVGEYPAQALELFVSTISQSLKQPFTLVGEILLPETGLKDGKPVQTAEERDRGRVAWNPAAIRIREPARYKPACVLAVLASRKDISSVRLAQFALKSTNDEPAQLGQALISGEHTLTRAQMMNLMSRSENGEDILTRRGCANYFFEETEDENSPVVLTGVYSSFDSRQPAWISETEYLTGSRSLRCEGRRFLIANAQDIQF